MASSAPGARGDGRLHPSPPLFSERRYYSKEKTPHPFVYTTPPCDTGLDRYTSSDQYSARPQLLMVLGDTRMMVAARPKARVVEVGCELPLHGHGESDGPLHCHALKPPREGRQGHPPTSHPHTPSSSSAHHRTSAHLTSITQHTLRSTPLHRNALTTAHLASLTHARLRHRLARRVLLVAIVLGRHLPSLPLALLPPHPPLSP